MTWGWLVLALVAFHVTGRLADRREAKRLFGADWHRYVKRHPFPWGDYWVRR